MTRRRVFFVTVYAAEDCVTPAGRHELVVASRRQAKRAIRRMRARALEFYGAKIEPALQGDLHGTGWTAGRR